MKKLIYIFIGIIFLCGLPFSSSFAQHKGISFQAVLKDPDGHYPTASDLTVTLQILDPVNNCVLREEEHTGVNISNGYMNLVVGGDSSNISVSGSGNPSSILSMPQVMDNSKTINGFGCTYNPVSHHGRKLRIRVKIPRVSDGSTDEVVAVFNMRAVAYAVNSETLNGKSPTDFVNMNTTKNVTQENIESIFERFAKLDGILNASNNAGNTLGVNITGHAATATTATSLSGGVSSLLPSQSGQAGKYLKTDGANISWEAASAGSGGIGQVGINLPTTVFSNGADLTANGSLSATFVNQGANTVFAGPTSGTGVPSFRGLTPADIAAFDTEVNTLADAKIAAQKGTANGVANLDGASKIPLALLPNDVVFNSSVETGVLKLDGPSSAEIQISASTVGLTSYDIVLPNAAGAVGQVLKISSATNGGQTLNTSWETITTSGGTLSSVGLSLPSDVYQVANSPLSADGSINATFKSQTQKQVLAAPNAVDGTPIFRQLQISDLSNAGSAALYNVPVTGDAAGATQLVKGDDSRLTDARAPIDDSVTTIKIVDGAVTDNKISSVDAGKITGSVDGARLPVASGTSDGIVNQVAQSFVGVKTFLNNVIVQGALSVSGALSATSATITGAVGVGSISSSGNIASSGDISATGLGSFDRVKVANSSATCDGSTEGSLKYNSVNKKMEYCNGTSWTQISQGIQAGLTIGAPSSSLVKSGPVTFTVTYEPGTDSGSISLASGNITLGGTATDGCSVTGVAGVGSTRTVTVNGCTGTGTVNISIGAGTANSTTGDVASAAGPSTSYNVDNTGPTVPIGMTLGSVPTNLTNSPTITYTAASDVGGSTVANHQVQIIKTSDSSVVRAWANHTSGSDVGSLALVVNTQYSVLVRAVDALGNIGSPSAAVNWTSVNDPCLATPAIGSTCMGGALYLGQFDGGKYMVTPSGCTNSSNPTCGGGSDTVVKYWNDGTSNWYDIPGVESVGSATTKSSSSYRGNVNTTAIIGYYGPLATAAKYCDDMVYGGYNDWYLPSKSELAYMYCKATGTHNTSYPQEDPNCGSYGGKQAILTGFLTHYWSSTEADSGSSWCQGFSDGYQYNSGKNNGYGIQCAVRCVRRY